MFSRVEHCCDLDLKNHCLLVPLRIPDFRCFEFLRHIFPSFVFNVEVWTPKGASRLRFHIHITSSALFAPQEILIKMTQDVGLTIKCSASQSPRHSLNLFLIFFFGATPTPQSCLVCRSGCRALKSALQGGPRVQDPGGLTASLGFPNGGLPPSGAGIADVVHADVRIVFKYLNKRNEM